MTPSTKGDLMVLLLGHSKTIQCFKCDLIPQSYDSMILLGTQDPVLDLVSADVLSLF